MANLDFRDSRRVPVPFDPRLEVGNRRVVVARVERMQRVIVVVIFGAGNGLLEGDGAVLGQREVLDVADIGGAGVGRNQEEPSRESREQPRGEKCRRPFHGSILIWTERKGGGSVLAATG